MDCTGQRKDKTKHNTGQNKGKARQHMFNVILLDVTTAKHGIIPTERETEERGIITNREGHWVAAKRRVK